MSTSGNTLSKTGVKGNKWGLFRTRWYSKCATSKLRRSKPALLVIVLLASSATALTSIGIRRAMQSGNAAAFVSQSVPTTMTAGESYAVTVSMLNQGTTTWTPGQAYRLGSQNPQDNTTWMTTNRVGLSLGDSVSPEATTTFSFMVTAPISPGSYNFQWRMVRDGVEWFGAMTPNVAVQVVPPFTKLKEYVYAGGRLVTSEEISCVPTLSTLNANSLQGGGPGSFDFSMPSTCSWTATSNVGWITVTSSSSGSGNGTVNYSVAQNSGPQRVGTITVNGQAFNITQAPNPASCGFSLSKPDDTFPPEGGGRALVLAAGAGCAWNAVSSDTSWLTASPTDGDGDATINYSVTANNGQQRAGSISIMVGGQTFATLTVTQLPNQASCTFAFSPGSRLVGVGGENGVSFNVTTGAGCVWNAENNNGWITITGGGTNNTGSKTVTFDVHANNGASRKGSILVREQAFTITQCGFQVSPTSASFGPDGGTGSVTVSAAADCSWSAIATSWISITSGQSGVGNGIINYRVAAFNVQFVTRTGTIRVGNQVVTIDQAGIGTARPASTPTIKQTGMLQSPGSDAGPTATRTNLSAPGPWLASPFSRAGLVLLIACGVLALLLWIKRRQAHRRFTTPPANFVSRLRDQIASRLEELFRIAAAVSDILRVVAVFGKRLLAWTSKKLNVAVFGKRLIAGASDKLQFVGHFLAALPPTFKVVSRGAVMRLGEQKLARRSLEIVRIVARRALSSWRSSGMARLKPILRRAMVIAIVVRLAAPLTPAEAAGIVRAAQTVWREARAYVGAIANRPVNIAPARRSGMVASAAAQAEQVDELQVCPRQLVMFVGERYTLTPVALAVNPGDGSKKVVHGVGMSWSSPDISVARVSSFG